jgi:uncharacterized membrane protein YozB (DUF420 family)
VTAELLPPLNATLNGIATVLLVVGYLTIKRKNYRVHGWIMASAFAVSTLFLVGYLAHKFIKGGDTRIATAFPRSPMGLRYAYYVILFPHVLLAMVMVPMIFTVLLRAYWRQWEKHRRLARITFPIWLYVSVTGVVIYVLLYHVFPLYK